MIGKVLSTANATLYRPIKSGYMNKIILYLRRRCKILRLRKFIYHVGMYLEHGKTFLNNFWSLCSDQHIIAQFPPPGVVTDPSGRNPGTSLKISLSPFSLQVTSSLEKLFIFGKMPSPLYYQKKWR